MMKNLVYLSFFLLLSSTAFATNQDSLWSVWSNESAHDTTRLEALKQFTWNKHLFSNPDSGFFYAQMQYDYAEQKNQKKYMGWALNYQAVTFIIKGNPEEGIAYNLKGIEIFEEIENKEGRGACASDIGNSYMSLGNLPKAMEYYTAGLKIFEEIGKRLFQSRTLGNIGNIYSQMGDQEKAKNYFKQSLEISRELEDDYTTANTLLNLGSILEEQGQQKEALDHYKESLILSKKIGYQEVIFHALGALGNYYNVVNDIEKSLTHYQDALEICRTQGFIHGEAISNTGIGNCYMNLGQTEKALTYYQQGLKKAKESGQLQAIREGHKSLYQVYRARNNYRAALENHEQFLLLSDSIKKDENKQEIIRQEYQYEYEKQTAADSVANAAMQKIKDAEIAKQNAELEANSKEQIILYGGLGLIALFSLFIFNRFRVTNQQKKVIEEQKEVVDEQRKIAENQRNLVEIKNKEILDSIAYAKRIQTAILPPEKLVKQYLKNAFILYKPKDIVAGDFYWMEAINSNEGRVMGDEKEDTTPIPHNSNLILFAAADCTGHGVPGAMVSVVCNNGLNRSVREFGLTDPGAILDKTREIVIQEFEKSEEEVKDGMDIALCSLKGMQLSYAGAHNPLWVIRNNELIEIKANKQPIGKFENIQPYQTHQMDLVKGDTIYIFSDGYSDQFGGEKGKKLKSGNFKKLLLSIQKHSMEEQKEILHQKFENWRDNIEQLDDVCVIGVRI